MTYSISEHQFFVNTLTHLRTCATALSVPPVRSVGPSHKCQPATSGRVLLILRQMSGDESLSLPHPPVPSVPSQSPPPLVGGKKAARRAGDLGHTESLHLRFVLPYLAEFQRLVFGEEWHLSYSLMRVIGTADVPFATVAFSLFFHTLLGGFLSLVCVSTGTSRCCSESSPS